MSLWMDDVLSLGTDDVVGQLLRSERSRHAQHADGGSVNPLAQLRAHRTYDQELNTMCVAALAAGHVRFVNTGPSGTIVGPELQASAAASRSDWY